jgi:general secretion pathway protein I
LSRTVKLHTGCSCRRGERGFALLEILVAFVILALGLGAISTGVAVSMRSDGRTQTGRIALRLAQSRLEAAGLTNVLVPGRREGRLANDYKWRETVSVVSFEADPSERGEVQGGRTSASAGIVPVWVEIAVQGPDRTVARLSALKLVHAIKQ